MKRVPILKQLIRSSCDHEREFVDLLSQEERDQIGTLEQWSAKDLIAHIAAWRDRRA
ncbi:MAG: hypothetical protein GTO43_00285, partial [Armatimonadetes bacterium]|nr:hypothetical protein [Armatimonadota bacterium]